MSEQERGMSKAKCVDCKQLVDRDSCHLVKTSSMSGRGWRCGPCGEIAAAQVNAVNAEIQDRRRRAIVAMYSGEGSYDECYQRLLRQDRPEMFEDVRSARTANGPRTVACTRRSSERKRGGSVMADDRTDQDDYPENPSQVDAVTVLRFEVQALREQNRMLRDAVEGRWFPDDLSEDGEPTLPRGWAIIDAGRLDELEDLEERHRNNLRAVAAFEGAVRELETSNAELRRRIQQATQTLLRPPGDPESTRRLVLDQLGYGLLGRIDKEM